MQLAEDVFVFFKINEIQIFIKSVICVSYGEPTQ